MHTICAPSSPIALLAMLHIEPSAFIEMTLLFSGKDIVSASNDVLLFRESQNNSISVLEILFCEISSTHNALQTSMIFAIGSTSVILLCDNISSCKELVALPIIAAAPLADILFTEMFNFFRVKFL